MKNIYVFKILQRLKNKVARNRFKHVKFGKSTEISLNCSFGQNVNIGGRCILDSVSVGDFSYINYNSIIKVTSIARFCSIGPNVVMGLGNHPSSVFVSTSPHFYLKENFADKDYFDQFSKVHIGNDVWIGANVTVLNGVTIGNGAIIGANSVVTKDVEPFSIVGGVPAKFIRKRFSDKEIEFLQDIAWWTKDIQWIKDNYKNFHSIKEFIDGNTSI
tara:strand:- start:7752 stop:8399 length:648 start_codon:yes stop_codon:yes gene_type:complete